MSLEKDYKAICMVVGRNMTRVLRFLHKSNTKLFFYQILENYKEDELLHYDLQLRNVLCRLKKYFFIEIEDGEGNKKQMETGTEIVKISDNDLIYLNKKGKMHIAMTEWENKYREWIKTSDKQLYSILFLKEKVID